MKYCNVLLINGRFLTQKTTGVQRYAIEIMKQLDKIQTKYEIILLVPKKGIIQNLELKNIKVIKIGRLYGQLWEQISLPLYIIKNKRKAKLLNMCNLAPICYPGYTVIHDILFKTHPEHLSNSFVLWYKFITKINIHRYNHIFTVSEFSKNEIVNNYKINKDKITVTYNSAEHMQNIVPDFNIIKKLNLECKEFYFALGSKSPHKNHNYIIECAKKNSDILFVVSGSDNSIFKNEDKKEKMPNLIYTGYLTDEEIVALYQECKAFIFPSLYEGFGIPPLEASTCGCKNLILSDIEVLREIYEDNAVYVKTKISKNLPNKLIDCDRNGLLKKYSWSNSAKKILNDLDNK